MSNKTKINTSGVKKMPMVFYLTLFIFAICAITATFLFGIYIFALKRYFDEEMTYVWLCLLLLLASTIISTTLVRGFGNKIVFRSIRQIISASKAVANGDFSQRLEAPREKEIAEICESFNEMVNKLGNNELLARDFISNVSHQFRTPLASIHGYAQLLESEDLDNDEKQEYIGVIKEKALALSELVNDVLELSRLEHLNYDIEKEKFSLDEQLTKCIINLEDRLSEKNIEVDLQLKQVNYIGNQDLLCEVWNNLLENSIKFSNVGGTIEVTLDSDEKYVTVTVADFGIGMSEETMLKMYERFYRGAETQNTAGCGLGMVMVKNIITKHGGEINVESALGEGSKFSIILPIE